MLPSELRIGQIVKIEGKVVELSTTNSHLRLDLGRAETFYVDGSIIPNLTLVSEPAVTFTKAQVEAIEKQLDWPEGSEAWRARASWLISFLKAHEEK